jgi:tRNA A-37 threonylcarbamoyl transferase component Bud32
MNKFKKVSYGDIKGWVREDIIPLLPLSFFEDPIPSFQKMEHDVIRESKLRWAAILTLPGGRRIFLKRDRAKGWFESLKFLFSLSKARNEWFIAYQLQKRKLNIPKPLGWMEKVHWGLVKESYYLSEAIGSGVSLIEDSSPLRDESIAAGLAKTFKEIHDTGLFHKDLHAGNFLWDGGSFFLTDLHRSRILKPLTLNQRLWNFAHLFHSLSSVWETGDQVKFLEEYFRAESISSKKRKEYLKKIHSWMDRLQKRQWKSRTKRCLKESTEFSIEREEEVRYYRRRDYPMGRLKKVIEEHLCIAKEMPMTLAKNSPQVTVSILGDGEKRVCLKHFLYPKRLSRLWERIRRSKGLKAWIAGNGLITRGIPSLKPFALVEKRDWLGLRESFFLMEASETGQELDRYLFRGFRDLKGKRLFIKAFAQWLSHLHKMDLYHQDMKTCNVLVSENDPTWNFYLLDLDDVRLDEKVDEKKLFRNLLQLNASTPKIMTKTDRLRFFHQYLIHRPISLNDERLIRQVAQETARRGVVYVAPWGIVEENSVIHKV